MTARRMSQDTHLPISSLTRSIPLAMANSPAMRSSPEFHGRRVSPCYAPSRSRIKTAKLRRSKSLADGATGVVACGLQPFLFDLAGNGMDSTATGHRDARTGLRKGLPDDTSPGRARRQVRSRQGARLSVGRTGDRAHAAHAAGARPAAWPGYGRVRFGLSRLAARRPRPAALEGQGTAR